MKLVLTTVVDDAADVLDAHLAFHLNAGVDGVIATDPGSQDNTTEVLESYEREGYLRRVPAQGLDGASLLTDMARLAVAEYGADWVIPSKADEFWWPRGESLKDVLAVIPPRYGVVQGLVRTFAGRRRSELFANDMTARTTLLGPEGSAGEPLQRWLRPVYRADPNMVVDPEDWTLGGRRVPLRAWYPIEVFQFPATAFAAVDDARVADLVARGTLVVDTRLRDALRTLGDAGSGSVAGAAETGIASRFRYPPSRTTPRMQSNAQLWVKSISFVSTRRFVSSSSESRRSKPAIGRECSGSFGALAAAAASIARND